MLKVTGGPTYRGHVKQPYIALLSQPYGGGSRTAHFGLCGDGGGPCKPTYWGREGFFVGYPQALW